MHVGRQFEVSRGLGAGDLGQVAPVVAVVQRVLVLDQEFWENKGRTT